MFAALIVSNVVETPRWITEYVSFKSERHAQRFLDGTALDSLPEGDILGSTTMYPPDGQPVDPLLSGAARPFTSQSEAQAIAVAEAVRDNPPKGLERQVSHSTPIYLVDPLTQSAKAISGLQMSRQS